MPSGRHIRLLPGEVANKIAAGEVVDRPAAVLKELIENSIDAGATQIDVDVVAGGRKLIAVADNGSGMDRDDALLSVERHATSKIRDVDDIERITTLGFRGEALAAIASVSRFRLATATAESPAGSELLINGGKFQDVREIGLPAGTTVEVRDLFFNVPARRKFLRSVDTELAHLRQVFIVNALGHPAVGMALKVDGREAYRLAAGATLDDRLRELFGAEFHRGLRRVEHATDEARISGLVSLPSASRGDRSEEYIFVNSRPATAPVLGHALREGYRNLLPRDRYPSVFLFLTLDPGQVDVNVHPTKKEVRFRRPSEVRDALIEALRRALASEGSRLDAAGAAEGAGGAGASAPFAPAAQERLIRIEDLPPSRAFQYPRMPMTPPQSDASRGAPESESPWNRPTPALVPPADGTKPDGTVAPAAEPAAGGRSPWAWCRVVGQIGALYVILETEDGFVIMDPHAAHERVLFEKFMSAVAGRRVETQGLLVPETVELMPRDALQVRKHLPLLRSLGFGVSEFGGDAFVVDAFPAFFAGVSSRQFLIELAEALELGGARGGSAGWREEAVAQAACKAAVKARDKLTLAEIEKLVVDLAVTAMPYTCPHGRPTLIYTSLRDLNRKFGRQG